MGVHPTMCMSYDYDCYLMNLSLGTSLGYNGCLGVTLTSKNHNPFVFELKITGDTGAQAIYDIKFTAAGWEVSAAAQSAVLKTFAYDKFSQACVYCVNHNDPAPGKIKWTEREKHLVGEVYLNFLQYRITKPVSEERTACIMEVIDQTRPKDKLQLEERRAETLSIASAKDEFARHYEKFRRDFYMNRDFSDGLAENETRWTLKKPTITAPLAPEDAHWERTRTNGETCYSLQGGENDKIYYCIFNSSKGYKAYKIVNWRQKLDFYYFRGRLAPEAQFIGESKSLRELQENCLIDYNSEYSLMTAVRMKINQRLTALRINLAAAVRGFQG